jgi:NAD(P)-dependent dehydrogenase (short-subunit alcohol dehydrogenase family)
MAHQTKTILITGASSGIGEASAKLFLEKGWNVVATMRATGDRPAWMHAQGCLVHSLDVTDRRSIDAAVDAAYARFGHIDVLFNNAGYGLNGPLEGATDAQMFHQFDVNVFGQVRVMQSVLPQMRARRAGLILTTSSIGGLIGFPTSPFYIASKHAVEGLVESARFELRPFGVRLKLIEPGGIKTNFSRRSALWTGHPDYAAQIAAGKIMAVDLLERMPSADKVAKVVWRAVNDQSDRLRYLAEPGPYLALRRLLPDRVWRNMIQSALDRTARRNAAPHPPRSGSELGAS